MSMSRLVFWAALAWIIIIPLAIANGLLREFVLTPWLGLRLAQPISGLLLILCITAVAGLLVKRVGAQRQRTWIVIGIAWGIATFAFECLMLVMAGKGLADLAAQYDFTDNNIWPLVLLWTISAPAVLGATTVLATTRPSKDNHHE